MEYRYEKEQRSFEDYASGRVLYNAPGATAFPVRLASELYQRAKSYLPPAAAERGLTVYDPCCGGAYLLTVLGILHGEGIARLIGSDVSAKAVELAHANLQLVNCAGLNERMVRLTALHNEYGKPSHMEALESAERLKERVLARRADIEVSCFEADATAPGAGGQIAGQVDLLICDVPYGGLASWTTGCDDPATAVLEQARRVLAPISVAVLIADKKQTLRHPEYERLERIQVGKRHAVILKPKGI